MCYSNLKLFYDLLKADYFERIAIATILRIITILIVLNDHQKISLNT